MTCMVDYMGVKYQDLVKHAMHVKTTIRYKTLLSYDSRWDKTYSCYGSRQTLPSQPDSILCLMRIAQARFLSDKTKQENTVRW